MGDETGKRRRPNAGYELTNRATNEEPVFYYSRKKRLEKAPPGVRELYEAPPKKKGLFRALTATKPLAILFWSIMVLSLITIAMGTFGNFGNTPYLSGNRLSVESRRQNGETFLVLRKELREKRWAYKGMVEFSVFPAPAGGEGGLSVPEEDTGRKETVLPVYTRRIYFSSAKEEVFPFSVPFEADILLFRMKGGRREIHFSVDCSE
ncbi:MAG: hypothetical protein LBE10_12365 [Treponema sp.]|jgi:hypothetical protein|nr:hypothetical protein [Treponema sp.]